MFNFVKPLAILNIWFSSSMRSFLAFLSFGDSLSSLIVSDSVFNFFFKSLVVLVLFILCCSF